MKVIKTNCTYQVPESKQTGIKQAIFTDCNWHLLEGNTTDMYIKSLINLKYAGKFLKRA